MIEVENNNEWIAYAEAAAPYLLQCMRDGEQPLTNMSTTLGVLKYMADSQLISEGAYKKYMELWGNATLKG